MSREAIWDALARQASNITGIRAGYSLTKTYVSGTANPTRPGWPGEPPASMVALVMFDDATSQAGNRESIDHSFRIRIYTGTDERQSQLSLVPMWDLFLVAFRSNVRLYQTATRVALTGYDEMDFEVLGARRWFYQDIIGEVLELNATTYSVGGA